MYYLCTDAIFYWARKANESFMQFWRLLRTKNSVIFFSWLDRPSGTRSPHCWGFEIIVRHTTLDRTPLDDRSAHSKDLYLTTHNTYKRQITMGPPPRGIRTRNPSKEVTEGPRLRQHGHRDRQKNILETINFRVNTHISLKIFVSSSKR